MNIEISIKIRVKKIVKGPRRSRLGAAGKFPQMPTSTTVIQEQRQQDQEHALSSDSVANDSQLCPNVLIPEIPQVPGPAADQPVQDQAPVNS
jgi:hypothetical protein